MLTIYKINIFFVSILFSFLSSETQGHAKPRKSHAVLNKYVLKQHIFTYLNQSAFALIYHTFISKSLGIKKLTRNVLKK